MDAANDDRVDEANDQCAGATSEQGVDAVSDDRPVVPSDAKRTQRLAGAVIDYALGGVAYAIFWILGVGAGWRTGAYIGYCAWLVPLAVLQATLVTVRGQSVGKLVARTRIQRADGRRIGFVHGVLLRSWLMGWAVSFPALFLADALWVYGRRRRCLHDRLADTRVIDLARSEVAR